MSSPPPLLQQHRGDPMVAAVSALPLPPPPALAPDAERAPVVLRQRAAAGGAMSAHARDRRSFIDRDGGGSIYNALTATDGGAVMRADGERPAEVTALPLPPTPPPPQQQRSTISDDGLWNGEPPVCCVCQTKIQR